MDLIIRDARIFGEPGIKDIGIKNGKIVKIGKITENADEEIEADGRLTSPSFIDPHIHLDKALIADNLPRIRVALCRRLLNSFGVVSESTPLGTSKNALKK